MDCNGLQSTVVRGRTDWSRLTAVHHSQAGLLVTLPTTVLATAAVSFSLLLNERSGRQELKEEDLENNISTATYGVEKDIEHVEDKVLANS